MRFVHTETGPFDVRFVQTETGPFDVRFVHTQTGPFDVRFVHTKGLQYFIGNVLGSLSSLVQRRGFDPPLRKIFPVEGIFPLELAWVLTPFPQNSFA